MPIRYSRRVTDTIGADLDRLGVRVLRGDELRELFLQRGAEWGLSRLTTFPEFLDYARTQVGLLPLRLEFPDRAFEAYRWRSSESLDLWRAFGGDAHLSHYSALKVHGLTDDNPTTVYVSTPSRPRRAGGPLEQDAVLASMPRPPRSTRNRITVGTSEIVWLQAQIPDDALHLAITDLPDWGHRVTSLEKTALDMVMRPDYCGGFPNVVEAFRAAAEGVSANKLVKLVRALDYRYPYLQAIGFMLERAGWGARALTLLRHEVAPLKFFVARGAVDEMAFDATWNVYYPPAIDDLTGRAR